MLVALIHTAVHGDPQFHLHIKGHDCFVGFDVFSTPLGKAVCNIGISVKILSAVQALVSRQRGHGVGVREGTIHRSAGVICSSACLCYSDLCGFGRLFRIQRPLIESIAAKSDSFCLRSDFIAVIICKLSQIGSDPASGKGVIRNLGHC